jgi:L-seryl-tRNA(Ser) seleniumtransferase
MSTADSHRLFRQLPSVDEVLRTAGARALLDRYPRWAVVSAARAEIAERRALVSEGAAVAEPVLDGVSQSLAARVESLLAGGLRRVLNATGVVLHTNLGRAPLAAAALARVQAVAAGYCNLEYEPSERSRGSRQDHLAGLLTALTGAEAAVVVNNNAGAVLLALAALAAGREVIVSRGELVEIGGGFRVPDVMRASGAVLVEVGTTNKTRLADYTERIGADTALLLKVHRSNFAIIGFTEDVAIAELATAGGSRKIPVMLDLGSGALADLAPFGLPGEPTVAEAVRQGADLVAFSGDKLLGGPQAGIVVGRRALVERLAKHPLMRALRPDKLSLAALAATLELYRDGRAAAEVPALRMLTAPLEELGRRKDALRAALLAAGVPLLVGARQVRSAVGGGALPLCEPETWAVTLSSSSFGPDALAARLAAAQPPLVARIAEGEVLLDVRTLDDGDVDDVVAAVVAACAPAQGDSRAC